MNNVENHLPSESKSNKDPQGMKNALSAIAQELQRLCIRQETETFATTRESKSDDIFEKTMVKSKLLAKNKQIKRLRRNFKTAYVVARSVIAREDETAYLSKHIQQSREQCECLLQKNRHSNKVIQDLKSEGQNLKGEKEAIEIFINLGYEQLQKMRNLPLKKIPVMQMLQEIMITCGEYYSDYENECVKTLKLEQKNRFLTHNISILSNSIKAISEELDSMRTQKMRLQTENEALKNKQNNAKSSMGVQEVECHRSFYSFDNKTKSKSSSDDQHCKNKPVQLNFSSHLTTIKRLLDDQDDMLKSLKKISEELTIHQHFCL